MLKVISILSGALLTTATAWALGRLLLFRFRLKLYREEEHLVALGCGSVLLGLVLFVLGTVRAYYDAAFYLLGAAALTAAWRTGALRTAAYPLVPLERRWKLLFLTIYIPFSIYAVTWALAPEFSPDGATYHLGVMSRYYREHAMVPTPTHMYGMLSQGIDLLFLYAFSIGRHSAAALTHCIFLLALPLMIVAFGRRAGIPGPSVVAALLVFAAPVVAIDGASAYNDVAVAFILFSIFYVAESQRERPTNNSAIILGILCGGAYAAKYTAFVAFPLAAILLFLALRRARLPVLRPLALMAAAAAVFIVPWMVRNWIWYSNPVAPLFNTWFPNPFINISFEQDYTKWMRLYPGVDRYADLPWLATVTGGPVGGVIGPVFLLAPLALFALRSPPGRRVLLAALVFLLPYPMNTGTRFLIPALPFIALAMALAVPSRIAGYALPALAAVHAVLSSPPVIAQSPSALSWHIQNLPWRAALRIDSPEAYLNRVSPEWRIANMIERTTPSDAVVLSLTQVAEAYTTRPIWVSYQSAEGERLTDRLFAAIDSNFQPVRRLQFSFSRQEFTAVRLVQTAAGDSRDIWAITELRLFDGDREVLASPSWKLRGSAAPWDLPLAFDGNPVTRWRAWRWLTPGMWLSVELPQPSSLTAVALDTTSDHYAVRIRLEGLTAAGWKPMGGEAEASGLAPPLGLRSMATRELLRAGVNHLAVPDSHPYSKDFLDKTDLWCISEAGSESGMRLYRLERACLNSSSASTEASPPPQPSSLTAQAASSARAAPGPATMSPPAKRATSSSASSPSASARPGAPQGSNRILRSKARVSASPAVPQTRTPSSPRSFKSSTVLSPMTG